MRTDEELDQHIKFIIEGVIEKYEIYEDSGSDVLISSSTFFLYGLLASGRIESFTVNYKYTNGTSTPTEGHSELLNIETKWVIDGIENSVKKEFGYDKKI